MRGLQKANPFANRFRRPDLPPQDGSLVGSLIEAGSDVLAAARTLPVPCGHRRRVATAAVRVPARGRLLGVGAVAALAGPVYALAAVEPTGTARAPRYGGSRGTWLSAGAPVPAHLGRGPPACHGDHRGGRSGDDPGTPHLVNILRYPPRLEEGSSGKLRGGRRRSPYNRGLYRRSPMAHRTTPFRTL